MTGRWLSYPTKRVDTGIEKSVGKTRETAASLLGRQVMGDVFYVVRSELQSTRPT